MSRPSDHVFRNYTFRLYPTHKQEAKLIETLDACRYVYNYFIKLAETRLLLRNDMNYVLSELKEEEPWLHNYHSKMLQMISTKLAGTGKALRQLKKNGRRIGKISCIKPDDYNSFTYNQSGFKVERHGNTDLLWLSKIGYTQIRLHRTVTNIKQITIVRKCEKWYAIICCGISRPIFRFIDPKRSVGIDVGITKFSHDSNNHTIDNPLYLKKMLKPLRRASRRLSRRKKDSNNWKKAKKKLQRLNECIKNKRIDFLHKVSHYYSARYDIIFLERLRIPNMVKNHHLARHILDSGWRTLARLSQYKAKMVVEVESTNTTIDCFRCNNRVPKSLATRVHCCDRCGLVIDRDYNASLNILKRGLLLLPQGLREVTPAEIHRESMKQERTIRKLIAVHSTDILNSLPSISMDL